MADTDNSVPAGGTPPAAPPPAAPKPAAKAPAAAAPKTPPAPPGPPDPPPPGDLAVPAHIQALQQALPGAVLQVSFHVGDWTVIVRSSQLVDVAQHLRDAAGAMFDYCSDLTAVDYSAYPGDTGLRFEVVYNLISTVFRHRIRLKVRVPEDQPRVDTVTEIWQTANWHERETYDLMGIIFNGHPDLRRILLPEDWVGHPLRKEYPLKGF